MKHFQTFLEFQKKYSYVEEGDRLLIAFSGGSDSVFLVEMLLQLQKILSFEMILVHLHHMIRGETADHDYEFCKNYAEEKNLEYVREKQDVVSYAKATKKSLEEAGRILRYILLERVKKEKVCNKILTAHHLDDHLETFFFRLLRGSSMDGLAGIARKQEDKIRPLRDFEKEEILRYLEVGKIPFCHDETNEEVDYMRNRIRLELLPQLSEYNPKWKEKISSFMEDLAERKEEETIILEKYEDEKESHKLSVTKLQKERVYLQKKVLYEYILSKQIPINRKQIDKIYTLLSKGGSLSYDLKNYCKFKKEYDRIWVESEQQFYEETLEEKDLSIPGSICFGEYRISTSFVKEKEQIPSSFYFLWEEGEMLHLRTYCSGDRIQLAGLGSPKKVKKIFINLKVPKEKRKKIPILEYQGKILALADLMIAKREFDKKGRKVMVKIEEVRH